MFVLIELLLSSFSLSTAQVYTHSLTRITQCIPVEDHHHHLSLPLLPAAESRPPPPHFLNQQTQSPSLTPLSPLLALQRRLKKGMETFK